MSVRPHPQTFRLRTALRLLALERSRITFSVKLITGILNGAQQLPCGRVLLLLVTNKQETIHLPKKMAALTYTGQKKAFVKPSRTYDHLYGKCGFLPLGHSETDMISLLFLDPLYRISSNKDHVKESFKAQTGPDRIVSHALMNSSHLMIYFCLPSAMFPFLRPCLAHCVITLGKQ